MRDYIDPSMDKLCNYPFLIDSGLSCFVLKRTISIIPQLYSNIAAPSSCISIICSHPFQISKANLEFFSILA